jgi:hypothetical protein
MPFNQTSSALSNSFLSATGMDKIAAVPDIMAQVAQVTTSTLSAVAVSSFLTICLNSSAVRTIASPFLILYTIIYLQNVEIF